MNIYALVLIGLIVAMLFKNKIAIIIMSIPAIGFTVLELLDIAGWLE